MLLIGADEWTAHPGSIGRPVNGVPHVVCEDGRELPLGGVGQLRLEEQVRAIVQPAPGRTAGPELEAELHAHVARYLPEAKRPHRTDFVTELPRLPTGRILRRVVRDRYTDS